MSLTFVGLKVGSFVGAKVGESVGAFEKTEQVTWERSDSYTWRNQAKSEMRPEEGSHLSGRNRGRVRRPSGRNTCWHLLR